MDLKKILTYSTFLALILVIGAIAFQLFGEGHTKDIPEAPKDAPVIGYWETGDIEGEHSITLEINDDGTVEGTIEGILFDGRWSEEDMNAYYIYNGEGDRRFSMEVEGDEMTLSSTSVTSTASRWTLYRTFTETESEN